MTTSRRLGRLVASASAVALLGAGLLGSAVSAEPTSPEPLAANIEGESGSLTIHKYAGYTGSDRDDGHPNDDVVGTPLEGVEFIVRPVLYDGVRVDLTTSAGWDLIKDLDAADFPPGPTGFTLGTPDTKVTGAEGAVTFPNLAYGLYFVEEGNDTGSNNIVSKVAPFLVTVPYPSDGSWIYDVHVYPKNAVDNTPPVKEVDNPAPAYAPGDTVTWTVTKTLPRLQDGEAFSELKFTDTFDDRLSITAAAVSVEGFTVGEDYTVDVVDQTATVTFTETGLSKLVGGRDVVVTFDTAVSATLSEADLAKIPNVGHVSVNDVEQTTNEVAVYYAGIQVIKVNAQEAPLAGAEFDIYAVVNGERVKLNSESLVTGADGQFASPFIVWAGTTVGATEQYVLVETKAPAGYILPDTAEWTVTVTAGAGDVQVASVNVTNVQHKGPDLPLTGAQGTLLLTLIGAGLIGAGAAAVGIRRARTNR